MKAFTGMAIVGCAAMLALPAGAAAQTASAPRLEQIMSAQEMQATGVGKLTPAERAALEAWLDRYTAMVAHLSQQSQPRRQVVDVNVVHGMPRGIGVRYIAEGGGVIVLEDGSRWAVYLPHRPRTTTWRGGDAVLLREHPSPSGKFRWRLINGSRDTEAWAKFAGREDPEDQRR